MPPVIVLPTAYTFADVAFSPIMAYPSVGSVLAIVPTSTSGICEAATAFGSVEPAVGALASPNRCALTIAPTSTVRAGGGAMTAAAFVVGATPLRAPSRVHVSCTSCQASRTTSKAETASGRSFCHPSARAPWATEAIQPGKTLIHAQGQLHQVSGKWPSGKAVPRDTASYGLGRQALKAVACQTDDHLSFSAVW